MTTAKKMWTKFWLGIVTSIRCVTRRKPAKMGPPKIIGSEARQRTQHGGPSNPSPKTPLHTPKYSQFPQDIQSCQQVTHVDVLLLQDATSSQRRSTDNDSEACCRDVGQSARQCTSHSADWTIGDRQILLHQISPQLPEGHQD